MAVSDPTIAAIATPPGHGGVGIVRVSGPLAQTIAEKILHKKLSARQAAYTPFYDQDEQIIDTGIALFFPGPHSFTGDDVLELQGHGGPIILDLILQRVLVLGAQLAKPGEFSERAFLNDKIDLAQAEAIADLISANTVQAARAAQQSLQGKFSQKIALLAEQIIHLRMYVEAAIDFPDEEIDFLNDGKVKKQLDDILSSCMQIQAKAEQGSLLQQGLTLVLAGAPNAGKSSLLNALAEKDTAIVTAIAGTTRDVLQEHINLSGVPLNIIDTAGLRHAQDEIEQEGIKRAHQHIAKADAILWVIDSEKTQSIQWGEDIAPLLADVAEERVIFIYNKVDASGLKAKTQGNTAYLSAKTGEGVEDFKKMLLQKFAINTATEDQFSARKRHLDSLQRAKALLERGAHTLAALNAGELLAEDLRQAHEALGQITGQVSADDLLGEIFGAFCIGK